MFLACGFLTSVVVKLLLNRNFRTEKVFEQLENIRPDFLFVVILESERTVN